MSTPSPRTSDRPTGGGPDAPGVPAPVVEEGVCAWPGAFPLRHGGELRDARCAWRLLGAPGAPVVAALGGISAHRRVAAEDEGWWPALVGAGRPLDTSRFRVLGIDFLGGSGDSTGPARGGSFPTIDAADQAAALARLAAELGIGPLHAIVGASYGGMVALAAGERHPVLARRLLVISAADRAHPMATAWRSVQREIVRYALARGDGAGGLKLARALAMATYRSPAEFATRFDGEPTFVAGVPRFPVEGYLHARGDAYAARYVPESFVCLSESIDLHRLDASRVVPPVTLVAVREDQLVPLADLERLAARLPRAWLHALSSHYGHDAFLKETELLRPVFTACLEAPVPEGPDR